MIYLHSFIQVALKALRDHIGSLEEVHILFFEKPVMKAYIDSANTIFGDEKMDARNVAGEIVEDKMEVEEVTETEDAEQQDIISEISEVLEKITNQVSNAVGEVPLNDIDNTLEKGNDTASADMEVDNAATFQEGCSMLHKSALMQDNNCSEDSARSKVSPKERSPPEGPSEVPKRHRASSLGKHVDAG